MMLLTFDTSLDKTYITLFNDYKLLSKRTIKSSEEKYHSAFLIPQIVSVLHENNISMQNIDVIATNIGPGSFTGIRVCTTIARVFAQQLNAKLIGISSLQILARINNTDKKSLVLADARKNKVYYAVYSPNGDEIEQPAALLREEILNLVKSEEFFIVADKNISEYLAAEGVSSLNYEQNDYELGEFLANIALEKITKNVSIKEDASPNFDAVLKNMSADDFNWAKLKPLYIQPPSISKPKQGK